MIVFLENVRKNMILISSVLILVCLSFSGFGQTILPLPNWEDVLLTPSEKKGVEISSYPNFTDNYHLSQHMKRRMAPYLLPLDNPLKPTLDEIFASSGVIEDEDSLKQAGFSILYSQMRSFIIVAKHPRIKGYLFKIYLDSRNVRKDSMVGWELLTTRCIVARKIQTIIRKHKLRHFTVADKWLYPLPPPKDGYIRAEPVVLLVKDMQIRHGETSKYIWKAQSTRRQLKELYAVLGRGYGSAFLHKNVPYTRTGQFAFIDTEYNHRKIPLSHVKRFLSPPMQKYWDGLVKKSIHKKSFQGPYILEGGGTS